MAKLNKQCYYTSKGIKKVNCYHVILSKELVKQAQINEDDEINVYVKNDKIIIEKAR